MRYPLIVVLTCMLPFVAPAQLWFETYGPNGSARTLSMAHTTIANPDVQTDLLLNPAMMRNVNGIVLFASPFYSRYTSSSEYSPTSYSESNTRKTTQGGISVTGSIPLGFLAIGGSVRYSGLHFSSNSRYFFRFDSSQDVTNYSRATSGYLPNEVLLQACASVGVFTVGVGASLLRQTQKMETEDIYTFTNRYEKFIQNLKDNGVSLIVGALLEEMNTYQASLSLKFTSLDRDVHQVIALSSYSSYPDYKEHEKRTDVNGHVRIHLSPLWSVGGSVSYVTINEEIEVRNQWSTTTNYEYRVTDRYIVDSWYGGFGAAFHPSPSLVFTAEYLIGNKRIVHKLIVPYDTYTTGTYTYMRGQTRGKLMYSLPENIFRVATEYQLLSNMKTRLGIEHRWWKYRHELWLNNPSEQTTESESAKMSLSPSVGVGIVLGSITLDYALSAVPVDSGFIAPMSLLNTLPDYTLYHMLSFSIIL